MDKFFKELRRRNVVRVAGVYAVAAWVLVQIGTTLEESLQLPGWFDGLIVALLIIGLPIALIVAWAFELTPEGVVRTEDIPEGQSITGQTGRKLDYIIIAGIVLLGLIIIFTDSKNVETDVTATSAISEPANEVSSMEPIGSSTSSPLAKSIAVLPFENRSPNPDDAFFAAGVHDDLLTHLSKIADMHVISRTSVMGFANTERKIPDIGKELGVATVMEGAVQRAGSRVRINVQLIDVATDNHVWAEIYDRELSADNIFDIQSEITKAIASALNSVLSDADESQLQDRPTQNLAAYDAFVTGKLLSDRYLIGEDIINLSIAQFDRAIALDPNFGEAYAIKAYAEIAMHWYTAAEGDWLAAAEASLRRAKELAPDTVETYTAQGYIHYWGHLDYAQADAAFEKALEKSPNYIDAITGKAFAARRDGRIDEAVTLLEIGRRLDPLNTDVHTSIIETLSRLGRFNEAKIALDRARKIRPPIALDGTTVAMLWQAQGDAVRAWQTTESTEDIGSTVNQRYRVDYAIETRNPKNMRAALDAWPEHMRRPGNAPEVYELARARVMLALGETDAARSLLMEIQARINSADVPYPEGWQANAQYYPVLLPGMLGDLAGVRDAIADLEANQRPDAWAQPDYFIEIARALIRSGEIDEALDYVDRIVEQFGPHVYFRLSIDPAFDDARNHPRYLELKALAEAWTSRQASTG